MKSLGVGLLKCTQAFGHWGSNQSEYSLPVRGLDVNVKPDQPRPLALKTRSMMGMTENVSGITHKKTIIDGGLRLVRPISRSHCPIIISLDLVREAPLGISHADTNIFSTEHSRYWNWKSLFSFGLFLSF